MEVSRLSLIIRGAALILCAYLVLGLLILTHGDPAEGQSQLSRNALIAVIFGLSVALGAVGGRDISSAARVIDGENARSVRMIAILLFLSALGGTYWNLGAGGRPSVGMFALGLLALYLSAGAFLSSMRKKSGHGS